MNAPNAIRHDKASRCIDVTCNIKGRDLGSAVEEAISKVGAQVQLPRGYHIEIGGGRGMPSMSLARLLADDDMSTGDALRDRINAAKHVIQGHRIAPQEKGGSRHRPTTASVPNNHHFIPALAGNPRMRPVGRNMG